MMNSQLGILTGRHPIAHYFRSSEKIDDYSSYDEWQSHFSRLMGIQGKALAEEHSDRNHKHHRYFNRFKKDHPDQLLLLHFNGNARDPLYETEGFFAGHWLYVNGARVLSELPARKGVMEIEVSDASLFLENIGRAFDRHEDIGICRLGGDGKPGWSHAEQVQLVSIDHARNRLKIRRACYGTEPIALGKGEGYAAAHMVEGPWGVRGNNLMWLYNHSTACPKDERGRNCGDAIAEHMAEKLRPNGDLAHFDGLEFDVLFRTLFGHSYLGVQDLGPGKKRAPDCDADGVADMGMVNGIDSYEVGVVEMTRKLRQVFGESLLMADGMWHNVQRCFGLFNGVEVEGWPLDKDQHIQWSQGCNVLEFWRDNAVQPVFNYSKLSFRRIKATMGHYRLITAAALITDAGLAVTEVPPGDPAEPPPLWDELVAGERGELGWLGHALGPARHLAEEQADLLEGEGRPAGAALMQRIQSEDAVLEAVEGGLALSPRQSGQKIMRLLLPGIRCEGRDLLVVCQMTADPMQAYPKECARIYNCAVLPNGKRVEEGAHEYVFHKYAHANGKPFKAHFYYAGVEADQVDVEIELESDEPALLRSLAIYAHPDLVVREFEGGVVLANPSKSPRLFDLSALFPDRKLRRIRGTKWQDRETNNGQRVGDSVTLAAHDALLLAEE